MILEHGEKVAEAEGGTSRRELKIVSESKKEEEQREQALPISEVVSHNLTRKFKGEVRARYLCCKTGQKKWPTWRKRKQNPREGPEVFKRGEERT